MPRHRTLATLVAALLAVSLVSGCAGGFQAQYPVVKMVPADQALTHFNDPMIANAEQRHVSYLGAFEYVDYARYRTPDFVLESVYDVATSVSAVLQYTYTTARMIDTWRLNEGKAISRGAKHTVQAWHGKITYQPYRLTVEGQSCIAFESVWDYQPLDMQGRPTRVFFGYICAPPGKPLDEKKAVALISGVRFSDRSPESLVPVNSHRSVDQAAYDAARGVAGGSTGNVKFPFNFGTIYVEGGPERTS